VIVVVVAGTIKRQRHLETKKTLLRKVLSEVGEEKIATAPLDESWQRFCGRPLAMCRTGRRRPLNATHTAYRAKAQEQRLNPRSIARSENNSKGKGKEETKPTPTPPLKEEREKNQEREKENVNPLDIPTKGLRVFLFHGWGFCRPRAPV
jgi:hypothetical protein